MDPNTPNIGPATPNYEPLAWQNIEQIQQFAREKHGDPDLTLKLELELESVEGQPKTTKTTTFKLHKVYVLDGDDGVSFKDPVIEAGVVKVVVTTIQEYDVFIAIIYIQLHGEIPPWSILNRNLALALVRLSKRHNLPFVEKQAERFLKWERLLDGKSTDEIEALVRLIRQDTPESPGAGAGTLEQSCFGCESKHREMGPVLKCKAKRCGREIPPLSLYSSSDNAVICVACYNGGDTSIKIDGEDEATPKERFSNPETNPSEPESFITCPSCKKWWHETCGFVNKQVLQHDLNGNPDVWVCPICMLNLREFRTDNPPRKLPSIKHLKRTNLSDFMEEMIVTSAKHFLQKMEGVDENKAVNHAKKLTIRVTSLTEQEIKLPKPALKFGYRKKYTCIRVCIVAFQNLEGTYVPFVAAYVDLYPSSQVAPMNGVAYLSYLDSLPLVKGPKGVKGYKSFLTQEFVLTLFAFLKHAGFKTIEFAAVSPRASSLQDYILRRKPKKPVTAPPPPPKHVSRATEALQPTTDDHGSRTTEAQPKTNDQQATTDEGSICDLLDDGEDVEEDAEYEGLTKEESADQQALVNWYEVLCGIAKARGIIFTWRDPVTRYLADVNKSTMGSGLNPNAPFFLGGCFHDALMDASNENRRGNQAYLLKKVKESLEALRGGLFVLDFAHRPERTDTDLSRKEVFDKISSRLGEGYQFPGYHWFTKRVFKSIKGRNVIDIFNPKLQITSIMTDNGKFLQHCIDSGFQFDQLRRAIYTSYNLGWHLYDDDKLPLCFVCNDPIRTESCYQDKGSPLFYICMGSGCMRKAVEEYKIKMERVELSENALPQPRDTEAFFDQFVQHYLACKNEDCEECMVDMAPYYRLKMMLLHYKKYKNGKKHRCDDDACQAFANLIAQHARSCTTAECILECNERKSQNRKRKI